jgi:hypothetical protein
MLLFPVIPSYSAGHNINNTSQCDGDFVDSWCATYNPTIQIQFPVSKLGGFGVIPPFQLTSLLSRKSDDQIKFVDMRGEKQVDEKRKRGGDSDTSGPWYGLVWYSRCILLFSLYRLNMKI